MTTTPKSSAARTLRADIVAEDKGFAAGPESAPHPDEYMCPNCVTPWKCNGPHIPESAPQEQHEDRRQPCPACPDGNEWDSNGPTGRACQVCNGRAYLGPLMERDK